MLKSVKQMLIISGLILLMLCFGSIWVTKAMPSLSPSFQLTVTPEEFQHWEVLKVAPVKPGYFWVFFRNSNYYSEIKIVIALIDINHIVHRYRYFRGINAYEFVFDSKTGKYIGGVLTWEKRQKCFKCHKNLGQEAL